MQSPRTGTEVIQVLSGERWKATVSFNDLLETEWRLLLGTLAGLNGQAGQLLLPVLDYAAPVGGLSLPASVTASGSAGAFTLSLQGVAGTNPILKTGDLIGVANRLYLVTADTNRVSTTATVPVWPGVRGNPSGAAASFTSLVCLMRLASDETLKVAAKVPVLGEVGDLELVEPLP